MSKPHRAKVFLLVAIILLAVTTQSCVERGEKPAGPPKKRIEESKYREKTLIFARGADSIALDPHMITDGESALVTVNIFDTLVRYKEESTEIEPALAESWESSEDGLTWIFHLRKGVKFHDGTPFNAYAVKFDIERQIDENHPYHMPGKFPYAQFTLGMIEKVEVIDEYTVSIKLKYPYAPFLQNLAMFAAAIVSPEAVKKYGEEVFKHPVGTGPFRFVEWIPDDRIVLEANPNYWDGPPQIERLIIKTIPENSVRLLALEKGEIDAMDGLNPDDVERVKKNPDLVLLEQPGMNIGYLGFHTQKKPFDDPRVRRAISHAINKKEIVVHLFKNMAIEAKGPLPPTIWGYDPTIEGYEYNPEKARQLLAEAGYPNGFTTTLWTYPNPRSYNPVGAKLATAIQNDLKEVGVKAEIVQLEWGAYLAATKEGKHDMFLLGWMGDNGDPDNFLYVLFSSDNIPDSNRAFYKNPRVDELLLKAQKTYDKEERARLYREAQRIIVEDAPWVFLNHMKQQVVVRKNVEGFKLHPTFNKYFHKVRKTSG